MAVRFDPTKKHLECAVGDLLLDAIEDRFALAPAVGRVRQQMGRDAHEKHQDEQLQIFVSYRREIHVTLDTRVDDITVKITGRIDGARQEGKTLVVEEVKSVVAPTPDLSAIPGYRRQTFEEQAAIYCLMLQAQTPPAAERIRAEVVLISVIDGGRHTFDVDLARYTIDNLIHARIRLILANLAAEKAEHDRRKQLALTLPFPFGVYRPHQDQLTMFMAECAGDGVHAMACAPTGIGKTAAALFAMGKNAFEAGAQLFYVTPKNTQQTLVLETAKKWHDIGHPVRVAALRAKAKMCLNDVLACHPDLCPFARDYEEKLVKHDLPQRLWDAAEKNAPTPTTANADGIDHTGIGTSAETARTALETAEIGTTVITPDRLQMVGREAEVCPFELGLDLSVTADVIVGDYNYVFDPAVALKRFFGDEAEQVRVGAKPRLVVDEAHALYDRGCEYYSPALWLANWARAQAAAKKIPGDLGRELSDIADEIVTEIEGFSERVPIPADAEGVPLPEGETFDRDKFAGWRETLEELFVGYLIVRRQSRKVAGDDAIAEAIFEFFRFETAVQLGGPEFTHLVVRGQPDDEMAQQAGPLSPGKYQQRRQSRQSGAGSAFGLKIHCADPSRQISQRFASFHSVAAVSGTLTPMEYYRRVLGFPDSRTQMVELPSPFPRENLRVMVDRSVSTVFRQRDKHVPRIAETILDTAAVRPGNYLAAFPSYSYMNQVASVMRPMMPEHWPDQALVAQRPSMSEAEREAFLAQLDIATDTPRILLVVQGGIFSEGVDYAGEKCIGVFVVGPALPRVGLWQDLKQRYFDAHVGDKRGFDFAYLYPGMTRVIQTAGRVIRRETDIGIVALLDFRFASEAYQTCMPRWWWADDPSELTTRDLPRAAENFWHSHGLSGI